MTAAELEQKITNDVVMLYGRAIRSDQLKALIKVLARLLTEKTPC